MMRVYSDGLSGALDDVVRRTDEDERTTCSAAPILGRLLHSEESVPTVARSLPASALTGVRLLVGLW